MPGIRPLSPELEAIARKELNEVPERREQDIAHIKEWLERQPHLNARKDDQFILMFLRGCKFSLERTKEKLDAYYTYRTALSEFFARRDPMLPELQEILNSGITMPLRPSSEGRFVWFSRLKGVDSSKWKVEDVFKAAFMLIDVRLLEDDSAVICGQDALFDLSCGTVAQMAFYTPACIKKALSCIQDAYPLRLQSFNFVNAPPFFGTLLNFVRSILKDKLKKRMTIYPSLENLLASGLKPILPEENGGDAGPMAELLAANKAKLESYRDYFLEDEKYRADESRRPGKPKTQEDLFGMTGSFRKLIVD